MQYQMRKDLYHCVAGQKVIFLDLFKDRYLALPQCSTQAFRRLVAGNGNAFDGDKDALAPLVNAGYLLAGSSDFQDSYRLATEIPTGDISFGKRQPFRIRHFLVALYWELLTSAMLKFTPLSSVVARYRNTRRKCTKDGEIATSKVHQWASAFDSTALILGRADRCLVRSLAMFNVLRRSGFAAEFIIGVRSDPFSAHAWVQREGVVLNDTIEQITNYTPILVIT